MKRKLNRREFLKAAAAAGAVVAAGAKIAGTKMPVSAAVPTPQVFLPAIMQPSTSAQSKVIQVHSLSATHWTDFSQPYWKFADQATVTKMVERGLRELTGAATAADAWRILLPRYQVGQKIAIKINCNTVSSLTDVDGQIESVAEPIIGVISGLVARGVAQNDIWVYDAIRAIPDRIAQPIHNAYSGVVFYNSNTDITGLRKKATFNTNSGYTENIVQFTPAANLTNTIRVSDVVVQASYLINMPLLKKHSIPGVTLGFKNHFGTINRPGDLHTLISPSKTAFPTSYSLLVDLYKNKHIGPKTVITIADGLFGYPRSKTGNVPSLWTTFGNKLPNSLFFATDPVAIDCVLADFLNAEVAIPANADLYLKLASQAGLGVYERGNPWGNGYSKIKYLKVEI